MQLKTFNQITQIYEKIYSIIYSKFRVVEFVHYFTQVFEPKYSGIFYIKKLIKYNNLLKNIVDVPTKYRS